MRSSSRHSATEGLKGWQYWLLILLSGVALVIMVFNMLVASSNQTIQEEVTSNQQYINQTIRISRLNGEMIQALASLSAQTGDESIRKLLAKHGITFNVQVKH